MLFQNWQGEFWNNFTGTIGTFSFLDLIDILAVSAIIYYGLQLMRETRAIQLVKSIGVIFLLYFFSGLSPEVSMITLRFFLGKLLDSGLVVLVVLFQPELRRAMEHIGRSRFSDINPFQAAAMEEDVMSGLIEILCESCEQLSASRTGALMVIERETKLGDIINTGTVIDAMPSVEMIGNIFFTNSPLHDGATVIREGRLFAAGCFLPLSENRDVARDLGTRHRAALGMSEVSDALIIVVSEETGNVSVTFDSRIQRQLSIQNLRKLLSAKLIGLPTQKKKRRFVFPRKES